MGPWFPGEALLLKLWETLVEKGIGSLLRPWQIKRDGRAHNEVRHDETVMLAKAAAEAEAIRAGRSATMLDPLLRLPPAVELPSAEAGPDGRIEPTLNLPAIIAAARARNIADSVRAEVNVSRAILHAESLLATDHQEPPERKIDDDWLFAWRDHAGNVPHIVLAPRVDRDPPQRRAIQGVGDSPARVGA